MSEEMDRLERVARAICWTRHYGCVGGGPCCPTQADCYTWDEFTDEASAAIAAMRPEPVPVIKFRDSP
jgi:hypothetical protein